MQSEDEEALGLKTAPAEFYDPAADDLDEKWASKQRQGRKSDAVLSCPGCLTTVCIDCQQHADFEGQFRAMFTINCRYNMKDQLCACHMYASNVKCCTAFLKDSIHK